VTISCHKGVHPTAQLRRSNFTRRWRGALEAAGLTGIHFHDLRHTGNTLAAEAGASLRELVDQMGHSTTRAAYVYQHRTSLRDKIIADQISARMAAEHPRSGTQRARDTEGPS
jgi:integrase